MNCSPLGSSVHGILQARILEWVAIPFFRDLPSPGIKPRSPALQADSLPSEPPGKKAMITWSFEHEAESDRTRRERRVFQAEGGAWIREPSRRTHGEEFSSEYCQYPSKQRRWGWKGTWRLLRGALKSKQGFRREKEG